MIRINLLESLPEGDRMHAALHPGGASAFISKREVLLGGSFLLLGAVILAGVIFTESRRKGGRDSTADVEETPTTASAPAPVAAAPQPAAPEPTAIEEAVGGSVSAAPAETGEQGAADADQPLRASAAGSVRSMPAPQPAKPQPTPPAPAEPDPAAPSRNPATWNAAAELTDITVDPLGPQLRIFLAVDGQCDVKTFNLDNPGRVVVDVQPARLAMSTRTIEVGHRLIQRIRIAQNQLDPPKVRLVMDAGEFPDMIIVDRSGGFEFMVTPDQ